MGKILSHRMVDAENVPTKRRFRSSRLGKVSGQIPVWKKTLPIWSKVPDRSMLRANWNPIASGSWQSEFTSCSASGAPAVDSFFRTR